MDTPSSAPAGASALETLRRIPLIPRIALGAAVLALLASLGPWSSIGQATEYGYEGDALFLGLILLSGLAAYFLTPTARTRDLATATLFGLAALLAIYQVFQVNAYSVGTTFSITTIGWGLLLACLASLVAVGAFATDMVLQRYVMPGKTGAPEGGATRPSSFFRR